MKLLTHNLICRFCQKKCGEYQYPSEFSIDDLKIADVRCDQHEAEFGSYSKMEQDFQGTHKDFISIMEKAEYKRSRFDAEVQKIKSAMIEPVLGKAKVRMNLKNKKNRVIIKKK